MSQFIGSIFGTSRTEQSKAQNADKIRFESLYTKPVQDSIFKMIQLSSTDSAYPNALLAFYDQARAIVDQEWQSQAVQKALRVRNQNSIQKFLSIAETLQISDIYLKQVIALKDKQFKDISQIQQAQIQQDQEEPPEDEFNDVPEEEEPPPAQLDIPQIISPQINIDQGQVVNMSDAAARIYSTILTMQIGADDLIRAEKSVTYQHYKEAIPIALRYITWVRGAKQSSGPRNIQIGQALREFGFENYAATERKDLGTINNYVSSGNNNGVRPVYDPLSNQKKLATIDAIYGKSEIYQVIMNKNTQTLFTNNLDKATAFLVKTSASAMKSVKFGTGSAGCYVTLVGFDQTGSVKVTGTKTFVNPYSEDQVNYFKRNGRFQIDKVVDSSLARVVGNPINLVGVFAKAFRRLLASYNEVRDEKYVAIKKIAIAFKKFKVGNKEYKIQRKFLKGQRKGGFNPAAMGMRYVHNDLTVTERDIKNSKASSAAKTAKSKLTVVAAPAILAKFKKIRDKLGSSQQKMLQKRANQLANLKAVGGTSTWKTQIANLQNIAVTDQIADNARDVNVANAKPIIEKGQ